MERGWPPQSLATSISRVSSPRAAKTRAGVRRLAVVVLRFLCDIALDVLYLLRPAAIIHAEGVRSASGGDFFKAGFGDGEERAPGSFFERELHERGSLFRIIHIGVHRIWVPGVGKVALRLHFLDDCFPFDMFVAGIGDVTGRDLAENERAIELNEEPLAELAVIGEGAPDAGDGSFEFDALFDAVSHIEQPLGCILAVVNVKGNLFVARCGARFSRCGLKRGSKAPALQNADTAGKQVDSMVVLSCGRIGGTFFPGADEENEDRVVCEGGLRKDVSICRI